MLKLLLITILLGGCQHSAFQPEVLQCTQACESGFLKSYKHCICQVPDFGN